MVLAIGGVMTMVLALPTEAEAKQRLSRFKYKKHGHFDHGHKNYRRNYSVFSSNIVFPFPKGFISISVGEKKYHYRDGAYYHKDRHGYKAVSAPIGACIARLPYGYQKFYIDGHAYYTYNDVYYKHAPDGYEVIKKPYSKRTKKHKKTRYKQHHDESGDEITLSIRNKKGEHITISVKPSGDGYVGPQGEYYDEFPKIDHLRMIYGS